MPVKSVVAISGAAGLLGPAVVRAFHDAGAALAVSGRSRDKLVRLLDSARVSADARLESEVDLRDPRAAAAWAAEVRARFGKVDALVHLVGGYKAGTSVSEIEPEAWQELQAMLVGTTLNVVQERIYRGGLSYAGNVPAAANAVFPTHFLRNTTRPVTGLTAGQHCNKALWSLAEEFSRN